MSCRNTVDSRLCFNYYKPNDVDMAWGSLESNFKKNV